ncbi:MAG: SURF1 family protein [Anaerolineales bacterium]
MKSYPFPLWLRVLTLIAIPIIAIGMLALGFWQLSRWQERRAENARIEARLALSAAPLETLDFSGDLEPLEYRPVTVRGMFDFSQEIVWRNRAYQGSPGAHVITPLRLADSNRAVLVDRGWLPALEAEPEARARYQSPAGEVTISGLLRLPGQRRWDFAPQDIIPAATGRLDAWFFLDVSRIQAQIAYPLLPVVVQQAPEAAPATLPLRDYELQLDEGPHVGYAIQWFAFAAIAIFGPLIYWRQTRRVKKQTTPPIGGVVGCLAGSKTN